MSVNECYISIEGNTIIIVRQLQIWIYTNEKFWETNDTSKSECNNPNCTSSKQNNSPEWKQPDRKNPHPEETNRINHQKMIWIFPETYLSFHG